MKIINDTTKIHIIHVIVFKYHSSLHILLVVFLKNYYEVKTLTLNFINI